MPIYQCVTPAGVLDNSLKSGLARQITLVHVETTGAPASFVHVIFTELPPGQHFTGGRSDGRTSFIYCTVRAGRPLAVRQEILRRLSQSWTRTTGLPESDLIVSVVEQDAETAMEGGAILPEPGDEAAWYAERARDRAGKVADR